MTTIELPGAASPSMDQAMTGRQWLALSVCVLLNVIDGFDILAVSVAADPIRHGLGPSTADLGLVLSASLAGMTLGALLLGPLADRFGRRPLILSCLVVELAGMLAAGFSTAGASLFAAMAGLYATAPATFPPAVRASATGLAFNLGRLGGTLSPVLGAFALSTSGLGVGGALTLMGAAPCRRAIDGAQG